MKENWTHYKTIVDGEYCGLDGINIWEYEWNSNYEKILIKDPNYGEEKKFTKFWIDLKDRKIEFVAGEFSNCIWGIYVNRKPDHKTKEFLKKSYQIARELVNETDLVKRIRNGAPVNEYDFLTTQILSDILNSKGNKEITESALELLTHKYGENKVRSKVANFDLALSQLADRIRKNVC